MGIVLRDYVIVLKAIMSNLASNKILCIQDSMVKPAHNNVKIIVPKTDFVIMELVIAKQVTQELIVHKKNNVRTNAHKGEGILTYLKLFNDFR